MMAAAECMLCTLTRPWLGQLTTAGGSVLSHQHGHPQLTSRT